jgi:hypothetical protein
MEAARETMRVYIRRARAPLLTALDGEYLRADETGNEAAKRDVALRKQVLRDLTGLSAIDNATTPDELRAVWPVDLFGPLPS